MKPGRDTCRTNYFCALEQLKCFDKKKISILPADLKQELKKHIFKLELYSRLLLNASLLNRSSREDVWFPLFSTLAEVASSHCSESGRGSCLLFVFFSAFPFPTPQPPLISLCRLTFPPSTDCQVRERWSEEQLKFCLHPRGLMHRKPLEDKRRGAAVGLACFNFTAQKDQ